MNLNSILLSENCKAKRLHFFNKNKIHAILMNKYIYMQSNYTERNFKK